jgi:3-hydroxyacyl-CoA dehydrogenase
MYKKVAVIGAGVMGSGIAAQIANNNTEVFLFDLENDQGLIAEQAIDKQLAATPSGFTHPSVSHNVTPLSLTKDLSRIAECDLIIEAIIEKIDVKQKLYNDLFKYLKHSAIIVSNTSTICLNKLTLDMGDLSNRIAVCHFFNPPRFLRLIELIQVGLVLKKSMILLIF